MTRRSRASEQEASPSDCAEVTNAAAGAERMISRMQDIVTEAIQPGGDQAEAFNELVEELDPAPEGEALREALALDDEGTRELPRRARRGAEAVKPSDTPPEYRTWRTGP
jgi:hypothetical protein